MGVVDQPPLTSSRNTADEMATASYNKIQPGNVKPFYIIKVQLHTVVVVIDEDSVPNAVSIHQIPAVPRPECNKDAQRFGRTQYRVSSQTMGDMPRQQNSQTTENVASRVSPQAEYAAEL